MAFNHHEMSYFVDNYVCAPGCHGNGRLLITAAGNYPNKQHLAVYLALLIS